MKKHYILAALILMAFAQLAMAVRDDALVVYFDFEEGSGQIVKDRSGKGNNGSAMGDAEVVDGFMGKGMKFDGEDDHIAIQYSDSMLLDEAVTFAGWFYFTDLGPNNNLIDTRIPEKWKDQGFNLWVQDVPDGNVVCPNADGWAHSADTKNGVTEAETWYHIAMVVDDSAGEVQAYINGVLDGEAQVDKGSLVPSDQPMIIGARSDIQAGACMHGVMDEVAVWNVALTPQEVKSVAEKGVAPVSIEFNLPTIWGKLKNTMDPLRGTPGF